MIITEKEIKRLAQESKGFIHRIYLHWTAGRYDQLFSDYHLNVDGAGQVHLTAPSFCTTLAHTWHRNTGSVAIALCCAKDARPEYLGLYPPTPIQLNVTAKLCALLLKEWNLYPSYENVRTHAEQADEDGYGPATTCERWDLWLLENDVPKGSGGSILRNNIYFYFSQL